MKEEEHALRRLMPGPRNWIKKNQIMTLSTWGGYVRDPQSLQLVALAAKYRLIATERCFRSGEMVKEVRALHSRTDTHTFSSNGEDKWIDGGILGGLIQAKEKVKFKGAGACKKNIASDRNKRNSTGKKTPGEVQAEVVKNLKQLEGKVIFYDIASRAYKRWGGWEILKIKSCNFEKHLKTVLGDPLKLVNPGVHASYVKVLMGGTCTGYAMKDG